MSEIILPAVLMAVVAGAGFRLWLSSMSELRRARRGIEEYEHSLMQREQADRERWRRIDLNGLHPLNREEVLRLLESVDADGVGALKPSERLFLDNMTLSRTGV